MILAKEYGDLNSNLEGRPALHWISLKIFPIHTCQRVWEPQWQEGRPALHCIFPDMGSHYVLAKEHGYLNSKETTPDPWACCGAQRKKFSGETGLRTCWMEEVWYSHGCQTARL